MLTWILSVVVVFAVLTGANILLQLHRRRARAASAALEGPLVRKAVDISACVTADASLSGSLREGRAYRGRGHLALSGDRLVLATDQGRVLEISAALAGRLRAPGPRMLIVEGSHPSGRARVRAELILDDEKGWLSDAGASLGAAITVLQSRPGTLR